MWIPFTCGVVYEVLRFPAFPLFERSTLFRFRCLGLGYLWSHRYGALYLEEDEMLPACLIDGD